MPDFSFYARHGFTGEVPVRFLATAYFDFGTEKAKRDQVMVLPQYKHYAPRKRG